jgi:sulfite oxidase
VHGKPPDVFYNLSEPAQTTIPGYSIRSHLLLTPHPSSVKWLSHIKLISGPSPAPVQRKEYLYFSPQLGKHNATYSSGFSIQAMPVSSAIVAPRDQAVVIHSGTIHMAGWAYSGGTGGNWPERVEVSTDGGSVWYETPYEKLSQKYYHAWRTWEVEVPVDAEGWLELVVRCWDNCLNTQPTFVRSAWNWDLHVTSSCHRIKVFSVNKLKPATARRLEMMEEKGIPFEPLTKPLEVELEDEDVYMQELEKRGGREPLE